MNFSAVYRLAPLPSALRKPQGTMRQNFGMKPPAELSTDMHKYCIMNAEQ